MTWNLPNVITTSRIVMAPLLVWLLYRPTAEGRVLAFVVFVLAAVSDLWDGWLARRRGEITDFGKLADPLADKLLLAAALVPFFLLTRERPDLAGLPLYGHVPLWVVLVLLGRELLVTGLRTVFARRGQVVQASKAGKYKAFVQNLFIGGMILWLALQSATILAGGGFWSGWEVFHGWWVTVTLSAALLLTVWSMLLYLVAFTGGTDAPTTDSPTPRPGEEDGEP